MFSTKNVTQRSGITWQRTLKFGELTGRSTHTLVISQVPQMLLMPPGSVKPPESAASTASLPPHSTVQPDGQAQFFRHVRQQFAGRLVGVHQRRQPGFGNAGQIEHAAVPGQVVCGGVVEAR